MTNTLPENKCCEKSLLTYKETLREEVERMIKPIDPDHEKYCEDDGECWAGCTASKNKVLKEVLKLLDNSY
jgi:hypothetical protein